MNLISNMSTLVYFSNLINTIYSSWSHLFLLFYFFFRGSASNRKGNWPSLGNGYQYVSFICIAWTGQGWIHICFTHWWTDWKSRWVRWCFSWYVSILILQLTVFNTVGVHILDERLLSIGGNWAIYAYFLIFIYIFGQSTSMRLWNVCKPGNIFVAWLVMEWMTHLHSRRPTLV